MEIKQDSTGSSDEGVRVTSDVDDALISRCVVWYDNSATDADCISAQCCHPNSCVAKENSPDCKGMLCSQECRQDTLDCQQGSCKCQNSQCTAVYV